MIKSKLKKCALCEQDKMIWANVNGEKLCKECSYKAKGKASKSSIKSTSYKPTGERELFLSIWESRNKKCEVTGDILGEFDVWCFAHLLSKKAYGSYRLNPENICMVKREIHILYDCSSREKLLEAYPNAIIMLERKERLRYEYYNGKEKEPDLD